MLKSAVKKIPSISRIIAQRDHALSTNKDLKKTIRTLQKDAKKHSQKHEEIFAHPRELLAKRYLGGYGIEIGAAHQPLKVSAGAHVQYVDIASTKDLRKLWPEIAKLKTVNVDVVDDGEKLEKFDASSQDFIIANHFMEHCLNPIGTILNFYRVLKPHGIMFLAIPDKRRTFDKDRPLTTYQHLLEEYKGARSFLEEHTREYVKLAEKEAGNIQARTKELIASGYRIHYHVWTQAELIEAVQSIAKDFSVMIEIEALAQHNNETILVIRKSQLAEA